MGFWDDAASFVGGVADAVAGGAEVVANGAEAVVNEVADVCADVVETATNAVEDGANFVGGLLSGIPVVGGFLAGTFSWIGGIVSAAGALVGAIIKGVLGAVGGVVGGLIKIIFGLATLHFGLAGDGLNELLSGIGGALLSIIGTIIVLVIQILSPLIWAGFAVFGAPIVMERSLTKEEKAMLSKVFQKTLSLYNIRLRSQMGIPGLRVFTLDNTIFCDDPMLSLSSWTLVHECAHVWQYQNVGCRYNVEALAAQGYYSVSSGDPNGAYDWLAELNRGTTDWERFNREAQAELINEIWTDGELITDSFSPFSHTVEPQAGMLANGVFYEKELREQDKSLTCTVRFIPLQSPVAVDGFLVHPARDGLDHTQFAIESVAKLRRAINLRLSQLIPY